MVVEKVTFELTSKGWRGSGGGGEREPHLNQSVNLESVTQQCEGHAFPFSRVLFRSPCRQIFNL